METAEVWNKLTSTCSGSGEGNTDSLMFFYLPKNCSFFLVVLEVLFGFVTVRDFSPCHLWQQVNGSYRSRELEKLPARAEENTTFGSSCKKEECEPWAHQFSTSKQHNPSWIKGGCYFFSTDPRDVCYHQNYSDTEIFPLLWLHKEI